MLVARTNFAMATRLDGTVLITGGYGRQGSRAGLHRGLRPRPRKPPPMGPSCRSLAPITIAYTLPNNGRVILVAASRRRAGPYGRPMCLSPGRASSPARRRLNTARSGNTASLLRRGGLIVAGGKNGSGYLTSSEVYGFATVATDKDDYHPGTAVAMSGSGGNRAKRPGAGRVLPAGPAQHRIHWSRHSRRHGSIQAQRLLPSDKSHAGVKFLLTATGSESKAQTQFTDLTYGTSTSLVVSSTPQAYGTSVTSAAR